MIRLIRCAVLTAMCSLLAMDLAYGTSVPSPTNSTCCRWIFVVGTNRGTLDPAGRCCVTVRDFVNNPIAASNVEINFQNCCDLALCSAVVSGQTVDCTGDVIRGITDGFGRFCFTILGASNMTACQPPAISSGSDSNCVRIYADGIQLCGATAVIYDLNGALGGPGANGVNGADVGLLKNDIGAAGLGAKYRGRSDYDCSGAINGADIGAYQVILGRAGLGQGSHDGCANSTGPVPFCPHPACPVGPCKTP